MVAASADFVYVWHYRTLMSKLTSVDSGGSSLRRKEGRERSFHIDDTPSAMNAEAVAVVAGREPSADPIVAVAASASCLLLTLTLTLTLTLIEGYVARQCPVS